MRSVRRPGRGHHDRGPPAEGVDLDALRRTAVDGEHPQAAGLGHRDQRPRDLDGQLTGGDEHEAGGLVRGGLADASDHRDAEGKGLARAGRGPAAQVVAGDAVRQGRGLHREGRVDALAAERGDQVVGHAEGGKGRRGLGGGGGDGGHGGTPQLALCTLNRATCEPKEADTIHEIVSWPAGSGSREPDHSTG